MRFPMPNSSLPEHKTGVFVLFWASEPSFSVSVSAITCHQYKASRVSGPAILSSICLGGDLGMLRAFRAQNRGFCALVMETLASGNRKARKFFVFARF